MVDLKAERKIAKNTNRILNFRSCLPDPPGDNVIKLFTAVRDELLELASVFAPGKPFQPNLMFPGKAGTYPNEEPLRCLYSRVGSWPCPQTID
jgi:hypothetical protein